MAAADRDGEREDERSTARLVLQALACTAALALAALLAWQLHSRKTAPGHVEERRAEVPVEVVRAESGDRAVEVVAHGTVRPARTVTLEPRVSGRSRTT